MKTAPLARSFSFISILIAFSRITGMIRDIFYARYLGAKAYSDAFFIAVMVPNLFRNLFGEGALSGAYMPVAQSEMNKHGEESLRRFFGYSLANLLAILTGFCALSILIVTTYQAFNGGLAISLLKFTLPYLIFICAAALCQANLNIKEHFFIPTVSSALFNILIIFCLIGGAPYYSGENFICFLAIAVPIIGLIQLLIHFVPLKINGITPIFVKKYDKQVIKEFLTLFFPSLFALSIVQINEFADTLVATWIIPHDGAVSHIYYANRLMQLPYALFGVSIATAVFPRLIRFYSVGDSANFTKSSEDAFTITAFWVLPASVGLFVAARPVVDLLFLRGEFSAASAKITSTLVMIYALGLPLVCFNYILTRMFYAMKDTKSPFKISVVSTICNFILNIILAMNFYENGIALATSVCALGNCAAYLYLLKGRARVITYSAAKEVFFTFIISVCSGATAYYCLGKFHVIAVILIASGAYLGLSFQFNRKAFVRAVKIV